MKGTFQARAPRPSGVARGGTGKAVGTLATLALSLLLAALDLAGLVPPLASGLAGTLVIGAGLWMMRLPASVLPGVHSTPARAATVAGGLACFHLAALPAPYDGWLVAVAAVGTLLVVVGSLWRLVGGLAPPHPLARAFEAARARAEAKDPGFSESRLVAAWGLVSCSSISLLRGWVLIRRLGPPYVGLGVGLAVLGSVESGPLWTLLAGAAVLLLAGAWVARTRGARRGTRLAALSRRVAAWEGSRLEAFVRSLKHPFGAGAAMLLLLTTILLVQGMTRLVPRAAGASGAGGTEAMVGILLVVAGVGLLAVPWWLALRLLQALRSPVPLPRHAWAVLPFCTAGLLAPFWWPRVAPLASAGAGGLLAPERWIMLAAALVPILFLAVHLARGRAEASPSASPALAAALALHVAAVLVAAGGAEGAMVVLLGAAGALLWASAVRTLTVRQPEPGRWGLRGIGLLCVALAAWAVVERDWFLLPLLAVAVLLVASRELPTRGGERVLWILLGVRVDRPGAGPADPPPAAA